MDVWINAVDLALITTIFAVALNVLLGYGGQLMIAPAGIGGVSGYLAAYLAATHGVAFGPALAAGVVAAVLVALVIGVPALRLSADYLVLLTLAFATIVVSVAVAIPALGGQYGLVGLPVLNIGGPLITPAQLLRLLLPVTIVCVWLCWRMVASPYGRVLRAIREDEAATEALSKNVVRFKIVTFAVTAAFMGVAGVLLVYFQAAATPTLFGFDQTTAILAAVVIGGSGNIGGSVVGAFVITLSVPALQKLVDLEPERASLWQLVIFGLLLIVVMRVLPGGLLPEGTTWRSVTDRIRRGGRGRARKEQADLVAASLEGAYTVTAHDVQPIDPPVSRSALTDADDTPVLVVRQLSKSFGGIKALRGLDLDLPRGKITAVVGPNGAGKTTVFNLVTGRIRPDSGEVLLEGADIAGMSPHRTAALGVVRSFQDVRTIRRLTLQENVALAVPGQPGERLANVYFHPRRVRRGERAARQRAHECLELVGLEGRAGEPAGELGYGDQKLLALARLLATEADVLLIDEPASGIDRGSLEPLLVAIEDLRRLGKTVCLVEHNLDVVTRLADRVVFVEEGRATAVGSMEEIMADERLAEVYFGHV